MIPTVEAKTAAAWLPLPHCRRGAGAVPAVVGLALPEEAEARTLHRSLIDQAVFSLGGAAGVVCPAAELPVCAVVQREVPGGEAAVALPPSDDCQGKLLRKRENRSVPKCHGINSLWGMLLLYKEK